MTYTPILPNREIQNDAGARARVSSLTTLFDGKVLNADDANLWHNVGTGTTSYANSMVGMSVAAGEYAIRQTRAYMPYFSGKSQLVEITFDTFANDAGVVKRVGYFSSSAAAAYDADYDGFWLEATGTSYKLCVANAGTLKLDLDWTDWDGYSQLSGYDWGGFSVVLFDFLWLGGAVLRMFVKTSAGFVLAHTFNFAGSGVPGVFMKTPQQPVRYEIRSTTGAGALTAICSQVASEGSITQVTQSQSLYTASPVSCGSVGTVYALMGIRALAAYRDQTATLAYYGGAITVSSDAGILLLLRNPTLSAPLTWAANGKVEQGTVTAQTVTDVGTVIDAVPMVSNSVSRSLERNLLAQTTLGVDNSVDELVVAYIAQSVNQSVAASTTLYWF